MDTFKETEQSGPGFGTIMPNTPVIVVNGEPKTKSETESNIGDSDNNAKEPGNDSDGKLETSKESPVENGSGVDENEGAGETGSDVDTGLKPTSTAEHCDVPPKKESPTPSVSSVDANDNGDSNAALHTAATNFDKKAIDVLLQSKLNVNRTNKKHRNALHEMTLSYLTLHYFRQAETRKTFIHILDQLIENGLNVNNADVTHKTPLHYVAPDPDQVELVKAFLNCGMEVNSTDALRQTPLHLAVASSSLDVVKLIVEKDSKVTNAQDIGGRTPLHIAARGRDKANVITYLIRHGAGPNVRDTGGRTPLHYAAKCGRVEHVEVLMDMGARIFEPDNSGQYAVHFAAANDITGKALRCLLAKAGPEILDSQDYVYGQTVLHRAVQLQMLENLKVLSRYKPNPNIQDNTGETALHKADSCLEIFVWKYLLSLRGDTSIKNHAELSPYQKALKAKNHAALALMAQLGLHGY